MPTSFYQAVADIDEAALAAADTIRDRHGKDFPRHAMILGSGLGRFGDAITVECEIPYGDIPDFPVSTVSGHKGRFLIGKAGDTPVICMQGRMHIYEGHPARNIGVPIRALRKLGVDTLILTNAAGSLRAEMPAGSLMLIEDHINFSGRNPLVGPNDEGIGPRFPDMTQAYDLELRGKLQEAAKAEKIKLHAGVYLHILGPNFETPAEIRAFRIWGADAVGMSTVPECLVARHCGMRVVGLSLITNLAAGIAGHLLTHEETVVEGEKAYDSLRRLFLRYLALLDDKPATKKKGKAPSAGV